MVVNPEEQPQGQETAEHETAGTGEPTTTRVEVETGGVVGGKVEAAGRDMYTGNVIVNVNVGTTSNEPERLAKEIVKNVGPAVAEAIKERKREEELEEQVAEYTAAAESPQDLPEVERWFREDLSTAREKYFAIALSLFNGLKWADFWDIYQAILESRDLLVDEDDKKGASLFQQTDQELVDKAKARIVRKEDQAAEVVEFTDAGYPNAVLDLLRSQYRPRLVELLPGLGKLGEHPYWEIRARAAYAVAEIGKLDFYRARRQVLEVWARHDRRYVRAGLHCQPIDPGWRCRRGSAQDAG